MTLDTNFYKILEKDSWYTLIMKIYHEINISSYNFFSQRELMSVCLPVTTGSVTSPMGLGSDSLPVAIEIFGKKQYLSDSMQFHLEYVLRLYEKGVYYIMPSFRGENIDSTHLSQFYHSEVEIQGNLNDVIELVNEYILHITSEILNKLSNDILKVAGSLNHIHNLISQKGQIKRISYEEVKKLLDCKNKNYFTYDKDNDFYNLTRAGEIELIKKFGFVWVTHFDYKIVPFYQKRTADNLHCECADLLMGVGETVGAGERCTTVTELLKSFVDLNVDPNNYNWYLKMKELSPINTSGFGLGIERYILWLLNHNDIRDIPIIMRNNNELLEP